MQYWWGTCDDVWHLKFTHFHHQVPCHCINKQKINATVSMDHAKTKWKKTIPNTNMTRVKWPHLKNFVQLIIFQDTFCVYIESTRAREFWEAIFGLIKSICQAYSSRVEWSDHERRRIPGTDVEKDFVRYYQESVRCPSWSGSFQARCWVMWWGKWIVERKV